MIIGFRIMNISPDIKLGEGSFLREVQFACLSGTATFHLIRFLPSLLALCLKSLAVSRKSSCERGRHGHQWLLISASEMGQIKVRLSQQFQAVVPWFSCLALPGMFCILVSC